MSLFQKKQKVERVDIEKRYNLIGRVGQGSMSKVWRAEDPSTGQSIAVKLLDKEKTARFEARFKGLNKPGEGDIALSMDHPYIVKTHEVGLTPQDETFLVMEYVEGCGLGLLVDLQSDRMRRFRIRYMIQIGEALAYFHENQWIHRDICPRNIMVTEDNRIKLIDFGLAVPDTSDFRKPGNRTGTANYMAPELIKRQSTDQRIDVFSYAVTCFEMYSKRHPWDAAMTIDAVLQHINKPPLQIEKLVPGIDSQIAEVIMKGLEANPADRWQTIGEMVKQFRNAEARLVTATRQYLDRCRAAGVPIEDDDEDAAGNNSGMHNVKDLRGANDDAFDDLISSELASASDTNGRGKKRRKKRKRPGSKSSLEMPAIPEGETAPRPKPAAAKKSPTPPAEKDSSPPSAADQSEPKADNESDDEVLSLD